jgi:hypothetical protein
LSDKGPDSNSLGQAVADLEALDARLAALLSAHPEPKSGGPDPAAPIRQSREAIRTAIKLLADAQGPDALPKEATGAAKRRVKIKAASETTKASAKSAARGGDGVARSGSAASAAATATTTAPRNSLLARLVAATPEPTANRTDTIDTAPPAPATPAKSDSSSSLDPADRLARLEAEIDSLTAASIAPTARKSAVSPDDLATSTEAKPLPEHRSATDDERDMDDDTEVVIVTSGKAAGRASHSVSAAAKNARSIRDRAPVDDDDAEVEIVQPGARRGQGRPEQSAPQKPDSGTGRAGAPKPADPAKWRLFRGSR